MAAPEKAKSHVSSKGQIVIPKSMRDAKGFSAGSEVEFVDHPEGVLLRLPKRDKKYTLDDLLNALPAYVGPPVTDEMIEEGINAAMRERWATKERNSDR
jgi:AbrB family looped-hinge helix DNA binding protein